MFYLFQSIKRVFYTAAVAFFAKVQLYLESSGKSLI